MSASANCRFWNLFVIRRLTNAFTVWRSSDGSRDSSARPAASQMSAISTMTTSLWCGSGAW